MKKRIVAIVIAIMACVSLLAMPVSALAIGDSNEQSKVVDSVKTTDVANAVASNPNSTRPVELATIKSSNGADIAKINIIPANAPQIANMTTAELESAIAVISEAVSTVSTVPSTIAAKSISQVKAVTKDAIIAPISFGIDVTFAFPVQISVNVGKSTSAGNYTLYYINSIGKISQSGTATVDANGVAKFSISHCSDYFLSNKVLDIKSIEGK